MKQIFGTINLKFKIKIYLFEIFKIVIQFKSLVQNIEKNLDKNLMSKGRDMANHFW